MKRQDLKNPSLIGYIAVVKDEDGDLNFLHFDDTAKERFFKTIEEAKKYAANWMDSDENETVTIHPVLAPVATGKTNQEIAWK